MSFNDPFRKRLIKPKELMDVVSLYLKNGFEKSRIKVDDQSTKVIQLKMVELQWSSTFRLGGFFKTELIIPEKNFSKSYEDWGYTGIDYSGTFFKPHAYAIHSVTRQIIDDPVIQDYILCR